MCVLSYGRASRFLFLWPWLWPHYLEIQIWPRYSTAVYIRIKNELSRSRLSKVTALIKQTRRQTRPNAFAADKNAMLCAIPTSFLLSPISPSHTPIPLHHTFDVKASPRSFTHYSSSVTSTNCLPSTIATQRRQLFDLPQSVIDTINAAAAAAVRIRSPVEARPDHGRERGYTVFINNTHDFC